jgi:hypothetical protein
MLGPGLTEVPYSKRVEKQIADIQEKSEKKRMEVSRRMGFETECLLMACGRSSGSNQRVSNRCRLVDRRRLWHEITSKMGIAMALGSIAGRD